MSSQVSLIAAIGSNRVIGKDNQMPWHYRADLKHFKEVTMGKPVIMGRLTHESIGRVLPGRTNIVVSRNTSYQPAEGAVIQPSLEEAIAWAEQENPEAVMVIGGGAAVCCGLTIGAEHLSHRH